MCVSLSQASEEPCEGIHFGLCGVHSGHEAGDSSHLGLFWLRKALHKGNKFIQWQHDVPKPDPALSIDYRKRPRRELASHKGSFGNLTHLCPLAIMDCCEDVKAAGYLGTLKLIFFVPLLICCCS